MNVSKKASLLFSKLQLRKFLSSLREHTQIAVTSSSTDDEIRGSIPPLTFYRKSVELIKKLKIQEEVIFNDTTNPSLCTITLNRPDSLNSLTLNMVKLIAGKLRHYEQGTKKPPSLIIIKGAPCANGKRALCAGGDIVTLTKVGQLRRFGIAPNITDDIDYFKQAFALNYRISTYRIPYLAIMDGITMGGGVGISIHARYRVCTERSVFAMPETAIGFFVDVGGSYFMPRMKGGLGMYLSLTGARLHGADIFHTGIATHYVHSSLLGAMESELAMSSSPSSIVSVLDHYHRQSRDGRNQYSISAKQQAQIDYAFGTTHSVRSIEQVMRNLEQIGDEWSQKQLKQLKKMSPFALKLCVVQMQRGAQMSSLARCLKMEYRLAKRFCEESHDFHEGVRALLIDKDQRPRWSPSTLAEVDDREIERYFTPLSNSEDELQLRDENLLICPLATMNFDRNWRKKKMLN